MLGPDRILQREWLADIRGVPPAEVLREGHLLSVCAGGGLSIDAVYLICPLSCLCSDVCLSELVGVFHCLSK